MSAIESEIITEFLAALAENENLTPKMIEQLKAKLSSDQKLNVDDLVAIFSPPPEEELA
jgi:hypothetical protein